MGNLFDRVRYRIRDISIKTSHVIHRRMHADDYIEFEKIIYNFRESGGLKNDFQLYKLFSLKRLLESLKPESILELGSGSSTVVFSNYVRENNYSLLSIDEDEHWVNNTKKLINLKHGEKIKVEYSKKVIVRDSSRVESKYECEIRDKYDLVFIDGPSLNINGKKDKNIVNSNIFNMSQKPDYIIVDGRKATALQIEKYFKEDYQVELSDLFSEKPVMPGYNYLSVFIKNKERS